MCLLTRDWTTPQLPEFLVPLSCAQRVQGTPGQTLGRGRGAENRLQHRNQQSEEAGPVGGLAWGPQPRQCPVQAGRGAEEGLSASYLTFASRTQRSPGWHGQCVPSQGSLQVCGWGAT